MERSELIYTDYQATLAYIDKCDDHLFKIRNWALIAASAVIAFSFSSKIMFIAWANVLLIPSFLYIELVDKSLQDDAIRHSSDLEKRIGVYAEGADGPDLKGYRFGIGHSLGQPTLKKVWSVLFNKNRRHILVFYVLLLLFSAVSFIGGRYVI